MLERGGCNEGHWRGGGGCRGCSVSLQPLKTEGAVRGADPVQRRYIMVLLSDGKHVSAEDTAWINHCQLSHECCILRCHPISQLQMDAFHCKMSHLMKKRTISSYEWKRMKCCIWYFCRTVCSNLTLLKFSGTRSTRTHKLTSVRQQLLTRGIPTLLRKKDWSSNAEKKEISHKKVAFLKHNKSCKNVIKTQPQEVIRNEGRVTKTTSRRMI